MSILIRKGYILTLDEDDRILEHGDLFIRGTDIVAIGTELDVSELSPDHVIDAERKLVMPGLINAHLHSDENLFKGCFEDRPFELWMLYRGSPTHSSFLGPELMYARTLLGAIEMVKTGVTMVQDYCMLPLSFTAEGIDAVFSAYRDIGVRANVALGVTDERFYNKAPFLGEMLPPELLAVLEEVPYATTDYVIKSYEETFAKWHEAERGRIRVVLSPTAPQRCTRPFRDWLRETSESRNVPLHIHIQETKSQIIRGWEIYGGRTLMQYIHDIGLLTPRTTVVDPIWVTDEEIEMMAREGVSVVHNPIANLNIGSGIMPMHGLLAAGINIALGTGGMSSNDNQNMFEVMKMAAFLHRITQPDYSKWQSADQMLHMATYGGSRSCLLHDQTGRLTVGRRADLVLYDLKAIPFTPLNNVKNQLVFCERGESVDTVIIDGKVVVEGGRVLTINEEDVLQQVRKFHGPFMEHWAEAVRFSDQLEPYLSHVYRRCVETPVGINRWAEDEQEWIHG